MSSDWYLAVKSNLYTKYYPPDSQICVCFAQRKALLKILHILYFPIEYHAKRRHPPPPKKRTIKYAKTSNLEISQFF